MAPGGLAGESSGLAFGVGLVSDGEVRRLAGEILSRPEYARYRIDEEAWLAFFQKLSWAFDAVVAWFAQLRLDSPVLYWLSLTGLVLLALALLAHAAWAIRAALRAPGPDASPARAEPTRNLVLEAERLAGEGRFLEAARRLEHAVLEDLMGWGALSLGRGDANRVLRRRIDAAPLPAPERRELLELLARLETRLFRDPEEDADLYQGWRRLHGRLPGAPA